MMKTALLILAGAATAFAAVPAEARHLSRHSAMTCTQWRHGHCIRMVRMNDRMMRMNDRMARKAMRRQAAAYRVGYRFAPDYSYTSYNAIPRPYVSQYHLNPDNRYVYRDNYIYVVDPKTYAVERVISALTH